MEQQRRVSMAGMSGWFYLLIGGVLEIVWAISAKARPWWTLYISIGVGAGSVSCLYAALETMPIGTAYAVWTGIGAAGSALVGIWLFGESTSPLRLGSLALVTVGLIGIGLSSR
jgi:quaternary ammonium compound-resistance protein SugE